MKLNRRDALKLGGVSVFGGAALVTMPMGRGADAESISQLSAADFPDRYAVEIGKVPAAVVGPFGSSARSSVHLHGSASLPEFDGYASDTTAPGQYKDYHYPNFQAARTLWCHEHGVHRTAQQAYGGLAAMYVMHDRVESTLLPTGDFDIPLLVNDAMFAADGGLMPQGVAVTSMGHGGTERYEVVIDSRTYGDVPLTEVTGTVVARLWPPEADPASR